MSSPDLIDPKFDELVTELRAGRPAAPDELRQRVEALELPVAKPRRAWRFEFRRVALMLAPVAAAGVVAAVAIGVFDSGAGREQVVATPLRQELRKAPVPPPAPTTSDQALTRVGSGAESGALPPTTNRAQLYAADLTVRVKDLSASTKKALNLTRSFGGYVRTVAYGKGTSSGSADLVVRIPIGSVQTAIVRFSALGRILDQHVRIQDIQPSVDARFRRLQTLRNEIATVQSRLAGSELTDEEKATLNAKLVRTRGTLTALQRTQAQAQKRANFATVSLDLRTKKAAVAPPAKPSRFDRTLDRIGDVLLKELEIVLYVLAFAAPILVLLGLVWWGLRAGRRRDEERLLAR